MNEPLGARLPMLVRGFYYEGWRPARTAVKERHREEFAPIQVYFTRDEDLDAETIVRGVFKMLSRHISGGEIGDIEHLMPPELRKSWP
jgi:uncharacterized protein (DUF2267 family)